MKKTTNGSPVYIISFRVNVSALTYTEELIFKNSDLLTGSARVFGYTVYRGFLNRVYGILQLKYRYSVYHFL